MCLYGTSLGVGAAGGIMLYKSLKNTRVCAYTGLGY
jgi:hypothetical protein